MGAANRRRSSSVGRTNSRWRQTSTFYSWVKVIFPGWLRNSSVEQCQPSATSRELELANHCGPGAFSPTGRRHPFGHVGRIQRRKRRCRLGSSTSVAGRLFWNWRRLQGEIEKAPSRDHFHHWESATELRGEQGSSPGLSQRQRRHH